MTWARFDDRFHDHAKILTAGNTAVGVFVRSITWSAGNETDGKLPAAVVRMLCGDDPVVDVSTALVAAGLWERDGDNYLVHDFLDYNPSAKQVRRERKARAEAGRIGGQRSGKQRRSNAEAKSKQVLQQNGSTEPSPDVPKGNPVPGPVPEPLPESAEADASAPELVPIDELLGSESAAEDTAGARKEQRACRLPKDFPLTAALRKVATDNGCRDPEVMHAAFVDYWRGTGRRMVDWTATYRTWARNGHCGNVLKACACLKAVVRGALGQELKGSQAAVRRAGERIFAEGTS